MTTAERTEDQYSLAKILGIWAVVSLPMPVLAFVIAPALFPHINLPAGIVIWLMMIVGMFWQFVVSLSIVYTELGTLRWSAIRERTWLTMPCDPQIARAGCLFISHMALPNQRKSVINSILEEKNMLSRLSDHLHARAKGWLILSVFIALVLFMIITLPLLHLVYPAANEMISPDDPVFYTSEEIFSIVEAWGDDGRTYQLWFHLTWDLVFPILGFLFVSLFISWLLQRGFRPGSKLQKLNLLALGSVFDLLENICLVSLIVAYPARPVAVAWLKTIFTMSKYGFAMPIILVMLIGLIKAAMNRFKVQEAVTIGS